jgi:hypothetical protein
MGNRLARGLVGRGHWLDMLGGDAGKVNKEMELCQPTIEMSLFLVNEMFGFLVNLSQSPRLW